MFIPLTIVKVWNSNALYHPAPISNRLTNPPFTSISQHLWQFAPQPPLNDTGGRIDEPTILIS